ncbi:MAG: response regulator [Pseudomonadota bacterium]
MGCVLIIDDDQSFREMVSEMVRRLGFKTRQMSGGQAVLDGADTDDLDVVLTDIFMPNGEGMETIRKLRTDRPGLGIVAMTGAETNKADRGWLSMAEAMGAHASLPKPFTRSDLSAALSQAMRA